MSTEIQILDRVATSIQKYGLTREKAQEGKAFCLAANLVEAATRNDRDYIAARNALCGHLGTASSYDGLVDWNDASYVDNKGKKHYKHSTEDAIKAIYATIAKLRGETLDGH